MNIEDFEDLIDRCGERPQDWPDDVRAEAVLFLNGSPQAQRIVADAASMRALFDGAEPPRAPEQLAGRIVALAGGMEEVRPSFNKNLRLKRAGSHGAAAARGDFPQEPATPRGAVRRRDIPRSYLWFGIVFAAGLGLGIVSDAMNDGSRFDFATLFAIINS
jgi:hypothetical protein